MRTRFGRNTLLLAALVAPGAWAQTLNIDPSDDIWAYGHATDGGTDTLMRVWGDGTRSYEPGWPPPDELSYGYLKFDLSGVSPGEYVVTSAVLTVTHRVTSTGTFTKEAGETHPLEVRALSDAFSEATWDFSDPGTPGPSSQLYGTGSLDAYDATQSFRIASDLTGQAFTDAFNGAVSGSGSIAFALTSTMPVTGMDGALPYRIFTKENTDNGLWPRLEVTYQAVPEPMSLAALAAAAVALASRRRR
ncbi:MAG: PEP-CTERM sorting domain-containing protein [Armatimonadetes bacterium]|nr:PEP-CTERM sorting domain-containing protein [Armatimonadota bacterium]